MKVLELLKKGVKLPGTAPPVGQEGPPGMPPPGAPPGAPPNFPPGPPPGMPPPGPPMRPPQAQPPPDLGVTPTAQVLAMQRQGLTNNQIIQTLQQQGFDHAKVFDAMNQAETKGGVMSVPNPHPQERMPGPPPGPPGMPAVRPQPLGGSHLSGPPGNFEQLAESIVEEKWTEFSDVIGKMTEWKDQTNERLTKMETQLKDFKADLDNLHKAIVSKIGEYDQNLLSVGTEIKAMEKVFQKVLPTFTENINQLSRVTKELSTSNKKPAPKTQK